MEQTGWSENEQIRDGYRHLREQYGAQAWWPCRSGLRWEIVAGAVLTQNCAWQNVERALERLTAADALSPEATLALEPPTLQELIRPAGFMRQKADYLKAVAAFVLEHDDALAAAPPTAARAWRTRLLAVRGVGRETADDILLYAYGLPVFIIDAYTRRFCAAELSVDGTLPYDRLQALFETALPRDVEVYQQYHALIVEWGKAHRSQRPSRKGE
ncbi:MAG: endonuclease III domain-containing protein [Oligosphaeraceae bacterium]